MRATRRPLTSLLAQTQSPTIAIHQATTTLTTEGAHRNSSQDTRAKGADGTALQSVALIALSTPAGAQLWACLLDEAEHTFQSVAAYAAAVVSAASAIASAQFAAALGL